MNDIKCINLLLDEELGSILRVQQKDGDLYTIKECICWLRPWFIIEESE